MDDLKECPRCRLAVAWRGDASGRCVDCDWAEDTSVSQISDPRDATIAALRAELEAILARQVEWQAEAARLRDRASEVDEIAAQSRANADQARADRARYDLACLRAQKAEADLSRHQRALAAGPAALRRRACDAKDMGSYLEAAVDEHSADLVEAAQQRALEEG
jgi:chromosome segregation ATPase